MKTPANHRKYLNKRNYPLGCSSDIFLPEELRFLRQYGYWVEALINGAISPTTDEQQHLIDVHNGKAEAANLNERAWEKLVGRRQWDKNLSESPHYELVDKAEQFFSREDWKKLRQH